MGKSLFVLLLNLLCDLNDQLVESDLSNMALDKMFAIGRLISGGGAAARFE